jgi:hypothetical protein
VRFRAAPFLFIAPFSVRALCCVLPFGVLCAGHYPFVCCALCVVSYLFCVLCIVCCVLPLECCVHLFTYPFGCVHCVLCTTRFGVLLCYPFTLWFVGNLLFIALWCVVHCVLCTTLLGVVCFHSLPFSFVVCCSCTALDCVVVLLIYPFGVLCICVLCTTLLGVVVLFIYPFGVLLLFITLLCVCCYCVVSYLFCVLCGVLHLLC